MAASDKEGDCMKYGILPIYEMELYQKCYSLIEYKSWR